MAREPARLLHIAGRGGVYEALPRASAWAELWSWISALKLYWRTRRGGGALGTVGSRLGLLGRLSFQERWAVLPVGSRRDQRLRRPARGPGPAGDRPEPSHPRHQSPAQHASADLYAHALPCLIRLDPGKKARAVAQPGAPGSHSAPSCSVTASNDGACTSAAQHSRVKACGKRFHREERGRGERALRVVRGAGPLISMTGRMHCPPTTASSSTQQRRRGAGDHRRRARGRRARRGLGPRASTRRRLSRSISCRGLLIMG